MKHSIKFILAVLLAGGLSFAGCAPKAPVTQEDGLELVILHTNDTHAHVAGIDKYGNAAFDADESLGGLGRIAGAVNSIKSEQDNVIFVDAGDQFQGTLFYSVNKWPMLAEIDRHMPWDAMTLGNHEFDEGCLELTRFIETLKFPVLAANLAPEKGCPLLKANTVPHIIKDVRGVKVGIVGIANDEVVALASACNHTKFTGAAETLAAQVRELEAQGVKHIIALTHIGLPADLELARAVDGVDVIVGGHTHSYLGNDSPEGPYPIVEHSPNGNPVLVVTAKRAAQYLGDLTVKFDSDGTPVSWEGSPMEMSKDMPSDPTIAALIDSYLASLDEFRKDVVGSHSIDMADGMDLCREVECLGGLLTADAMLEAGRPLGMDIAIVNGGGIRSSLPQGTITRGDILTVHPFGNMFVLREYSGEQIWEALEHGVSEEGAKGPRLLQVAGLRYTVDGSKPAGHRVLKVDLVDENGKAIPLDIKARYGVAISDYLAGGGDGYDMLKEGKVMPSPDPLIADVLEQHIRKHTPLKDIQTGRINRVN
ncbi:MAG: 5'-nucleotidase C-terminal domain-containing protein [Desulfovibrionaceae bacterium]|nr:5'-nucleotidase C-terminal domain-containing protein [Desulfovibrionaceae bacterium]